MSTSKIIALGLFLLAVILFIVVGADIAHTTKFNLVALGLASFVGGVILKDFVP